MIFITRKMAISPRCMVAIFLLLVIPMLGFDVFFAPMAAAQKIPDGIQVINPLQIALLKWSPNLTTKFKVGNLPQGIAFDGTNMWVANTESNSVSKLRTSD